MEHARYIIRGYCSNKDAGYDEESSAETLKEAKQRAKYLMSEERLRIVESLVPVVYVEIIKTKTDEVVADFGEPI